MVETIRSLNYGFASLGDTADFDFVALFFNLREVICHLHAEPDLRA